NRSASGAAGRAAECVGSRSPRRKVNPLFLHGPPGCGKSHLVAALLDQVRRTAPDRTLAALTAADFDPAQGDAPPERDAPGHAALMMTAHVTPPPARAAEPLVQFLDRARARQQQLALTATLGPARLADLPARLTSRLAQGLVVELSPLSPESRLRYLEEKAARAGLDLGRPVLEGRGGAGTGGRRPPARRRPRAPGGPGEAPRPPADGGGGRRAFPRRRRGPPPDRGAHRPARGGILPRRGRAAGVAPPDARRAVA